MPTVDDAVSFLIDYALHPRRTDYGSYGYGFYLPNVIEAYLQEIEQNRSHGLRDSPRARELSPVFYDAAWELCRRGILRPGISQMGRQATEDGASGNGYTVTEAGRRWLESDQANSFIFHVSRLNQQFTTFATKFGVGFQQRAQEAVRCHSANAFLACCAMCGAAAESILLSVAIAKSKNEEEIYKRYRIATGRRNLIEYVVGQAPAAISSPFRSSTSLLSYWRDDAAHGTASSISEIEAHDALARLLRFAQFASDEWQSLTN